MKTMDSDQIERLLEDITLIKTAVNRNKPLLRQVFSPARFRWFMLIAGLSVIGFSLLIYLLMGRYGGFGSIPAALKYPLYAAIAADLGFLQIWKLKRFSVSVKRIDQDLTLGWFFREFYSGRIVHLWVPLIVLVVFFSILFLVHDIPYYIVPTISIGYGLLSNFVGTMLEIRYSLIVGYWFLITGIATIVFPSIPGPIALCMTIGCGLLIFSIAGFLHSGSKEGD